MNSFNFINIFCYLCLASYATSDELVQVHLIFRHGDRTPLKIYDTDPNKEFWSKWPHGELTTIGMEQHLNQGFKLQNRYINKLKFINPNYNSLEISLESAQSYRCLQSCQSNMAAFYSTSQNTSPNDSRWPSNWTPVPVRTVSGIHKHTVEPFSCGRTDELIGLRANNKQFLEYEALHLPMISEVMRNTGDNLKNIKTLKEFYDCVRIEKEFYKLPQPAWITDVFYKELTEYHYRVLGFLEGEADFGEGESTELLKLSGGPFITKVLQDMSEIQNNTNIKTPKMFVYSAHDTSVDAVLRSLGIRKKVIGMKNVDYASMLAFELWKDDKNNYSVQLMFSANQNSSFIPLTSYIDSCSWSSQCPFSIFYGRNRPYLVHNMEMACLKVL